MLVAPLVEAGAITLAASGHLVSATSCDLVCVRGTKLDVYTCSPTSQRLEYQQADVCPDAKSTIEALAIVRPQGARRDFVLIAHAPATLSLHAWRTDDSDTFGLARVGACWTHGVEDDQEKKNSSFPDQLRVDPMDTARVAWVTRDTHLHFFHLTSTDTFAAPVVSCTLSSLGLGRVCDMQFLYGHARPTLLVLHELLPTWAGRYAAMRRTRELAVVAFDAALQAWAVVGDRLPAVSHEVTRITAVPVAQLGGALLRSRDFVAYWNSRLGRVERLLSVNAATRPSAADYGLLSGGGAPIIPIDVAAQVVLVLDQSHAVFVDARTFMVVDKSGATSLLHLDTRGASIGVSAMRLEALTSLGSSPQGCIRLVAHTHTNHMSQAATATPPLFFCFSRMGPSVLLSVSCLREETKSPSMPLPLPLPQPLPQSAAKRMRIDDVIGVITTSLRPLVYRAQICDRMVSSAYGAMAATHVLSAEPLELLQVGGGSGSGVVVHSRRGVAPAIETVFSLPPTTSGCYPLHYAGQTLILFSTHNQTIVIQPTADGQVHESSEQSPFYCASRTLAAANHPTNPQVILQVCTDVLRLVSSQSSSSSSSSDVPVAGGVAVSAQIAWPHVLLRLADGSIRLSTVTTSASSLGMMSIPTVPILKSLNMSASCLFSSSNRRFLDALSSSAMEVDEEGEKDGEEEEEEEDEEDALGKLLMSSSSSSSSSSKSSAPMNNQSSEERVFLIGGGGDGVQLEWYQLANDDGSLGSPITVTLRDATRDATPLTSIAVQLLHDEGEDADTLPTMLVSTGKDQRVRVYQAHITHASRLVWTHAATTEKDTTVQGGGKVAFHTIQHQVGSGAVKRTSTLVTSSSKHQQPILICASRGRVRAHTLLTGDDDDAIVCAASYDDSVYGTPSLVYVSASGKVSMGSLPASAPALMPEDDDGDKEEASFSSGAIDYDSGALVRQTAYLAKDVVPLMVAPHTASNTTAVVVKRMVRCPSLEPETERSFGAWVGRTEVLLLHSQTWEQVGLFSDLEPDEVILCALTVELGTRSYVALGTGFQRGEGQLMRGRIILLDLTMEPEDGETMVLRVGVLAQMEQLPVTAMCAVAPNLLCTCQGNRIILYERVGERLVGRAFINAQVYVSSVASLGRSWIAYGDLVRGGISLLYWDGVLQTLTRVGREKVSAGSATTACEFMVKDGKSVSLVSATQGGDLCISRAQPTSIPRSSSLPAWFEPEGTVRGLTIDMVQQQERTHFAERIGLMTRIRPDLLLLTQQGGALFLVSSAATASASVV